MLPVYQSTWKSGICSKNYRFQFNIKQPPVLPFCYCEIHTSVLWGTAIVKIKYDSQAKIFRMANVVEMLKLT